MSTKSRLLAGVCSSCVILATTVANALPFAVTAPNNGFNLPAPAITVNGDADPNQAIDVTWAHSGGSETITAITAANGHWTVTSTGVDPGIVQIGARRKLIPAPVITRGGTAT